MKRIDELTERYPVLAPGKEALETAARILLDCARGGGKILTCGNGGSAADAEHIVGELMKKFCRKRPADAATAAKLREAGAGELVPLLERAVPAVSLNSQTALMTAIANDIGGEMVFAQQVYGYGKPGDVLIGLSTSGNSKNVLNAALVARALGMKIILICGAGGGAIAPLADAAIRLPETETFKVQELTLPVYHALCLETEDEIFGA
jgi:D-sedoheptulose 7-phosphate isomerase